MSWLLDSLKSARAEVATWPEWKKKAMRVLPDPPDPQEDVREAAIKALFDRRWELESDTDQAEMIMTVLEDAGFAVVRALRK